MSHEAVRQFAPLAADYAASRSHAQGRTLAMLLERAEPRGGERALDVATGAGHTALAFADAGCRVTALDPAAEMVRAALAAAARRGIGPVHGVVSTAERLPFGGATFDVVTCRTAAHHFDDVPAALAEMRRVLRPGGRLALTDQAAADDPALRELQHRLEVLHDATHRRTWTLREWRREVEGAGFEGVVVEGGVDARLTELADGMRVAEWCARSRTPPAAEAEIRRLLREAPEAQRAALAVAGEGPELSFQIYKLVVSARVPEPPGA